MQISVLLDEISDSEYFSCEYDYKADPEYIAREFYAHVVKRTPSDDEIEMAVIFHVSCKDTLDRATNFAHKTEMNMNNLELKVTALQADLARDNAATLSTLASQYQEEMKMKNSSLQAEIATLKLVKEKYEEEMARKEEEDAKEIETPRESAVFEASAEILKEVTAKKDMKINKLQEKIQRLKKDLNASEINCERARSSQFNMVVKEQVLEKRLLDLGTENARLKESEKNYEAQKAFWSEKEALEKRLLDLDNENARLKLIEKSFQAQKVFWSEKIEKDHNSLGIIRALDEQIQTQKKVISDLKSRFEEPAADDKDARIANLLLQVNFLQEELDRWRPSAGPPSVGHDSDQGEGAERGRGRGRHGRRRQGRRV